MQNGSGIGAVAKEHEGQGRGEVDAAALEEQLPGEEPGEGNESGEKRRQEDGRGPRRVFGGVLEGENDEDGGRDSVKGYKA